MEYEISREGMLAIRARIAQIDEATKGVKRTGVSQKDIRERIEHDHADNGTEVADRIRTGVLEQVDNETLVALVPFLDGVVKEIKAKAKEAVKAAAKATPVETPQGDSNVKALREERKQLVKTFSAIKGVMTKFKQDVSDVDDPPKLRQGGGGGGRKKSEASGYQFYLNGKPVGESQNRLSSLAYAATVGLGTRKSKDGKTRMLTKELETYIKENGVDYPNQQEWEISLPNGSVIGGKKEATATVSAEAETKVA